MNVQAWTFVLVGLSFALYIGIAVWSRAHSTSEFYVAGTGVSPLANGMATAADWMSAASFISMAGIISFAGYDGSVYLMGWTGGYVLLALLLAPYLRKFGGLHGARLRGGPILLSDRAYRGRGVRHIRVVHVCRRPDARRGDRLQPLPRGAHRARCVHRHGDRVLLCRPGRHEGHHLYAGGSVLRADFRLSGARDLPLAPDHRQRHPSNWIRRCGPNERDLPARPAERSTSGPGLRCLHLWRKIHDRRPLHNGGPHGRYCRSPARDHPILHGAQSKRRPPQRRLCTRVHRPCFTRPRRLWPSSRGPTC